MTETADWYAREVLAMTLWRRTTSPTPPEFQWTALPEWIVDEYRGEAERTLSKIVAASGGTSGWAKRLHDDWKAEYEMVRDHASTNIPWDIDISDSGDEYCRGFIDGQQNVSRQMAKSVDHV